jgi:hypothetical protein
LSWTDFLGAVAGGVIGGGIPGAMTWTGWRREQVRRNQEQQWQDSGIVADARQFLLDVDPVRCGVNVNTAPGAEDARWASLNQRRDDIRVRLFRVAAGHPSLTVRSATKRLEPLLFTAAVQTEWQVADLIKHKDTAEHLKYAQDCHGKAMTALADLERAVKDAGRGR